MNQLRVQIGAYCIMCPCLRIFLFLQKKYKIQFDKDYPEFYRIVKEFLK